MPAGGPERVEVRPVSREAHLAVAAREDAAAQALELGNEVLGPCVEVVEKLAQEAVEVHPSQLLGHL